MLKGQPDMWPVRMHTRHICTFICTYICTYEYVHQSVCVMSSCLLLFPLRLSLPFFRDTGILLLLLPLNVILCGFYGFLKHSTTFYVAAIYLLFPRLLHSCPLTHPNSLCLFLPLRELSYHVLCTFYVAVLLLVFSCYTETIVVWLVLQIFKVIPPKKYNLQRNGIRYCLNNARYKMCSLHFGRQFFSLCTGCCAASGNNSVSSAICRTRQKQQQRVWKRQHDWDTCTAAYRSHLLSNY